MCPFLYDVQPVFSLAAPSALQGALNDDFVNGIVPTLPTEIIRLPSIHPFQLAVSTFYLAPPAHLIRL